ncbi:hypothetical protein E4U61_006631 [Claviceps capensis]|nr:hypothetical protein E4U61_006631 [Claviceps capensis]
MASKQSSIDLIPNPFIKRRNLNWTLDPPALQIPHTQTSDPNAQQQDHPSTSAVEASEFHPADHLAHYTNLLTRHALPSALSLLSIPSYTSLYQSHALNPRGSHFVIHQHDHPIAGTHYDLRLQINPTSSASWAIMYGPPGDPNSSRLSRNATETRVHCLWNHLVETASPHTGSMLIWDTGTYSVLPPLSPSPSSSSSRGGKYRGARGYSFPAGGSRSPSEPDLESESDLAKDLDSLDKGDVSQQDLLTRAFKNRKIRIRLHGYKLPRKYVLNVRLTRKEDQEGRAKNARGPMRKRRGVSKLQPGTLSRGSDSTSEDEKHHVPSERDEGDEGNDWGVLSPKERELRKLSDETVIKTNAYPGATNSIGSVHQRRWYLSLDRAASGFVPHRENGKVVWRESAEDVGAEAVADANRRSNIFQKEGPVQLQRLSYPFYVRGVEHERSVVTGRRGEDVLRDEGVQGFISRKGWKPVLE